MPTALVIADAELPSRPMVERLHREADLVVAADGGADRALDAGVTPDWVIGDMDGILAGTLRRFPPARIRKDTDPDTTDLEKAMRFLARRRIASVVLTGVFGGRLDHTLANLAVMARWHNRFRLRAVDDHFTTVVVDPVVRFRAPRGTLVSLVAPGGAVGVSTTGLRFPLKNQNLPFSTLGIHNQVSRNPVSVSVRKGPLFLMRSHEVRPHP